MFNQLTGINALLYYAPKVFTMGDSDAHAALLQSIPVGVMLVISTFVGMMVIDRFGRKTLLLVGMVVFLALVAVQFYSADAGADIGQSIMWYFIGYILFFGFSQGEVTWVFISEIFPNAVRAKGQEAYRRPLRTLTTPRDPATTKANCSTNAVGWPPRLSNADYFRTGLSSIWSNDISPTAPSRPMRMIASRAFGGTLMRLLSACHSNEPRQGPRLTSPTPARFSS